jgi:ABC-type Fe3+ transport system permease subunit/sugar lactone lactonase YvrE
MNWALLENSLRVAGGATVAAVSFGLLAALSLNAVSMRWRRLMLGAAVLALAFPSFLVTNCWLDLLGQAGRWRAWLPVNIYGLGGTIWVLTLLLWPITLLLSLSSLQKLQPSQLETEPALRGGSLLRWLLLPLLRPALAQSAILTFVLALNNFAVPSILQSKVFPAEIWVSFNTNFDYVAALQLSWPLLLMPLLLLAWLGRREFAWPRGQGGISAKLFRERLGRAWFGTAMALTFGIIALSAFLPLLQLATSERTWLELPGALAAGQQAVFNSVLLAAVSSVTCLALGLAAWRWRAGVALCLPFLLPGVMLGIALIYVFNRPWLSGFYASTGIVVLGWTLRYGALGWMGMGRAMQSMDQRLVEFARLNGASGWQRLRYVHGPQIAPEAGALWFVIYLLCLWDVETLVLITPPGGETLALRIFNLLHYGHNAQVNALCVLLLGLALWPLGAGALLRKKLGLSHLAVLAATLLATSGCQPNTSRDAPVQSRFFARVEVIGGRGTALGQFNKPRSVAVDAHDSLYVVDMTGRVQKFSSNGVYLTSWQMPQIENGKPKGMGRDKAGNIIVAEPHYSRVNIFSPEGKLLSQWGQRGTNNGQFTMPRGVAVTAQGDILVCEYTLVDCVQRFSALGKQWKQTFGRSGLGDGEFNRPEGLAVDREGRIYVADSCNHRIQIFSPEGRFLRSYGHAGTGLGEFSYPYDVQIDAAGFQYICEFGNSRIQIFDPSGKPVETLGRAGAAPGQFNDPWSIALDSAGNLYIADSQNHRVQKFLRKGPVLTEERSRVARARQTAELAGLGKAESMR